jgi:hypothetical protein
MRTHYNHNYHIDNFYDDKYRCCGTKNSLPNSAAKSAAKSAAGVALSPSAAAQLYRR